MILQALVHLYNELYRQGKIAEEGWGTAKVSHRIILDKEGTLLGIVSAKRKVLIQRGKTNSKKTQTQKESAVPMIVPLPVIRSNNIKPNFLCDNMNYFLGVNAKDDGIKARKCFESAQKLHHRILDTCSSPMAKAVLYFFDNWDINKAAENPILKDNWKDIKSGNFVFQVDGEDVLNDAEIREAWRKYNHPKAYGICLVTGEEDQPIALLHPKIKGINGANSSGANLVSFNREAFCSYGYNKDDQGVNAPVSESAAFAYGTALNYLLNDKAHARQIGDTTVVYWSEHAITSCQDCFMDFWDETTGGMDDTTLDAMMERLQKGLSVSLDGVEISPDEPFYILGLSPNEARVSVRFFLRNTFGEILQHMAAHQKRMRLSRQSGKSEKIPLWKIIKAAARPNADKESDKKTGLSPILAGSLMRSVLQDSLYPEALFQHVMMRIFADHNKTNSEISHVRAAFIKAYLLKNRVQNWEGQIQMAVNENCTNIAYVLGRMFSVLENIQKSANPYINATIKERYFNGACATPSSVFPTLLKLSNAHLAKLETKEEIYFNKKLGALMEKISMPDTGNPFPARLSLEEQGVFVLGYYQEKQDRYASKKEEN